MASSPNLTIRIGVDASGVTQGVQQTTQQINSITTQAQSARNGMNGLSESMRAAGGAGASLARPTNELRQLEQQSSRATGAVNQIKTALAGIGAMVIFGNAIKEMASFETKMLQLKALTASTSEQMKAMESQARLLGATTAFSAQQSADAQGVLASAGLKVNEILSATPKILQLASAGSMDLAKAAEYAISSMRGFGLSLADLGHINNVFTKVAGDSSTSVEQVGEAMKVAAPLAKVFGISLETMSASIGVLANGQIKGSEAGNNFKSVLAALGNETKDNIKILKDHHLTYKDLDVQLLGTSKVMETVKKAGFSGAEALSIFGSDAAAAALILADSSSEIKKGEVALKKVGEVAEEQSSILNQGLSKAWDSFNGTLSEAGIALGQTKAGSDNVIGGLTELIGTVTGVISIYEGMGEGFKESNKLTDEQYHHLLDVAEGFKVVAGGIVGIGALTGAMWGLNTASKAVLGSLALIKAHPVMAMGSLLIGVGGAVQAQLDENQSTLDKKIDTSEKRLAAMGKWGWQNMVGTAVGFDTNAERTSLESMKKQRDELKKSAIESKNALEQKGKQESAEAEAARKNAEARQAEIKKAIEAKNKSDAAEEASKPKKLTDEQKQANKEQEGYKKLIESTPIGEYNAKISELNNALKKGGIDQQTYNDLMSAAAAKYEKGTVGIDKMTAAEKERQRVFDGTARGKFEKSTDELRKAKPNMSEAEYANKQDKIGVDYLHESGMNKDAKTKIDAATEATKAFEEATKNAGKASFDLGKQNGAVFDGLLGGINAVVGAFANMSEQLDENKEKFDEIGDKYAKDMQMQGMTTEQKTVLTKQYYDKKSQYEQADLETSITGARQTAGAMSKMFSEKSAGRKAFHAVEMALSVVEMAMTAKKMIVDMAAGAAAMFSQSGWGGFAGVAAMAAVMGALGFGMMGGGSKEPVLPEHTKTTGTVLGDSEAQSHSINNVVSKLDEIHASEYPELRNIASSMGDLKTSISSMIAGVFKAGGVKMASITQPSSDNSGKMMALSGAGILYSGVSAGLGVAGALTSAGLLSSGMAAGVGLALGAATMGIGLVVTAAMWALSKVPVIGDIINGITSFISNGLFGKKTAKVVDGGININSQSMGSVIDTGMIDGAVSTIVDTKKSSWFSTSHKISEILTALDDSVKSGLGKVFSTMAIAVGKFWDFVGGDVNKGLEKIRSFTIPFANIKTFGMKDADIQKAFEDYSSMTFDNLVKHVFGGFVTQFQAVGESIGDTMNRLITDTAQVKSAFVKMGADMSQSNDHLIIFSESMIGMAGGLKNLIALADNFTSKFTSKDVKNKLSVDDIRSFASSATNNENLKSQGLDMTVVNNVLAAIDNKAITAADVTILKDSIGTFGSSVVTKASELSAKSDRYSLPEAAAAYADAFTHESTPTKTEQLVIDALNKTGVYPITNSTTLEEANAMNGGKVDFSRWIWGGKGATGTGLSSFLSGNSATQASGIAGLTSAGLPTDKKTFDTNKAAEAAIAAPMEALAVTTLQLTDSLGTVTDNLMNYAKIVEATANITKTAGDNISSTRANEIAGLSTQNEKDAKTTYYTAFDTKKWLDDSLAGEQRIYDLRHTAAEVTIANLQRNIEKIKNEATVTDTLNGFTQKRIDLLKQEYAASQFVAYDKKLLELKTGVLNLGTAITETDIITNNLKLGIQDLRDSYVEITDTTGNLINPISQLINLLIDTQVATSLKANADALKNFGKSAKEWVAGMKTTSVGNAKTQMDAAQTDFETKYNIITDKTDKYTNAQKSDAMSGMTAAADKLVSNIHKYGSNGDEAQGMVKDVMAKMETLPEVASLQALTFDALKESNGILTKIATNTGKAAGTTIVKTELPKDTKAMTLLEALDASVKISETATNTKSTADALDDIKGSQSALDTKIEGVNVKFDEIKYAPIEISPISLSLDTTGVSSILAGQLTVLNNILTALNKGIPTSGGGGVTNNGANSGNNNVINFSLGGGSFAGGTITPIVNGNEQKTNTTITPYIGGKSITEIIAPALANGKNGYSGAVNGGAANDSVLGGDNAVNTVAPEWLAYEQNHVNDAANAKSYGVTAEQYAAESDAMYGYTKPTTPRILNQKNSAPVTAPTTQAAAPATEQTTQANASSSNAGLDTLIAESSGAATETATSPWFGNANGDNAANGGKGITPVFTSASQKEKDATEAARYGMSTKDYIAGGRSGYYPITGSTSGSNYTASTASTPQITSTNNGGSNLNVIVNNNTITQSQQPKQRRKSLFYDYSYNEYALISESKRQSDFNSADNPSYFGAGEKQYLNEQYKLNQLSANDQMFSTTQAVSPTVIKMDSKKDLGYFAKGGVTNQPSIFGEAGWEAAVPLPDGRTIPVTIKQVPAQKQSNDDVVAIIVESTEALLEALARLQAATTSEQRKTTNATQKTSDKINTAQKARVLN